MACVAVTGCLGGGTTATPTPGPTAFVGTDCPPTLTVYELGEEPADRESAVAYDTLTAEQRATFDRARNGSVEDFTRAWYDIDVVASEGTYHRASVVVC
ncbi:hypothetical protein [Haloplanus pelagicus]|uniref:hypothetical protein n=1 Tax=Haloplanus pelagicus TaxID=2949995 RepID=UPI00203F1C66|nr:hypothetical protein [Haloplanus sp. HW8-1]